MKKICIITPCTRVQNLSAIEASLQSIPKEFREWYIIFDDKTIPLNALHGYLSFAHKDKDSVFGNAQRNYAIDLIDEDCWILFNDDDTTIHPDLWNNIKDCTEDFISFGQDNKDGTLRLVGDNISLNNVDSHNFIVSRKCIGDIRWDISRRDADGIFAWQCYNNAETKLFIPKVLSIYNSLT